MAVPIINPPGPLVADGLSVPIDVYLPTSINFAVTNGVNVVWSVVDGVLSNVLAQSVTWKIPNKTGTWFLRAVSAGNPDVLVQVTVQAMLPQYWSWRIPATIGKDVLLFTPYAGPTVGIDKGNGERWAYDMGNDDIDTDQWNELRTFWAWHYPPGGRPFWIDDPAAGRGKKLFEAISDFNWKAGIIGPDSYSFSFKVREAWPYGG